MSKRTSTFGLVVAACAVLLLGAGVLAQGNAELEQKDPVAAFDRGAELLAKDPFAAKTHFDAAANGFERSLTSSLSQGERAAVLYNIGASRQLAGDIGPAVLALRRAELLAPATPGLSERLAAARAAARGEAGVPLAAKTTGTGETFDAVEFARAWVLSIPRVWVWWCAIGAWGVVWGLAALRLAFPRCVLRPARSLIAACAVAALAPAGLLGVHEVRERAAERTVVVMADVAGRTEPDDLIGAPAPAGALRAGAEMESVEVRTGGNGMEWVRVMPVGADPAQAEQRVWVPASALRRVSERPR